ncbi:MAG: RNA-binding protein [Tissierellia bacterium]|jgi:ribosomal protein L14E/L6E/L27E|nr:RNA-binding protein [Tissierellia bacterium]
MNKFIPGQLVISKSGRDKGRMFLIMSVPDPNYVTLVDGKLRPLEKPKRKKIIHLQATNYHSDILEQSNLNNAGIRKMIQSVQHSEEEARIG